MIASLVVFWFGSMDILAQSSDRERLWREVREAKSQNDDVKVTVAYDQLVRLYNDPLAMNDLALRYIAGKEVPRNVTLAISLLTRSIQFGIERHEYGSNERNMAYRGSAATTLGFIYLTGVESELTPNSKLALEWTLRGASLGDTNAYSNLGLIYATGFGVDRSYATAVSNLIKSVETYSFDHAWLRNQPDEWEGMVKGAPRELWRARQLYWAALRTGDKKTNIKEMRQIEASLRRRNESAREAFRSSESIVKDCLSSGLKPGTKKFSECVSGS